MKYVVTGGGGFVGKAICLKLKELGHEVHALARREYPELEKAGIRSWQVDISIDRELWAPILEGADAVFHVAANVAMWGPWHEFFRGNVLTTRNIIQACREQRVRKLIYTSSPSVIADGSDLKGIDETYPYPKKHMAWYPKSKAIAEREVLGANESSDLWTLALRPHLIFGPGDQHFIPTIVARARQGRLPQIGAGKNHTDLTYIDDCVEAHLCALKALEENPAARGKVYFISQGEKVNMWDWIHDVIARSGAPAIRKHLPLFIAKPFATICEAASTLLPGHPEPLITRFLVSQMTTDHYFDITQAKTLLGFAPRYTVEEAMSRLFSGGSCR